MRLVYTIFLTISFFLGSCTSQETTKEEDWAILQEKYDVIHSMATSVDCTNNEEWAFTAIGSKACGGPVAFIAYPLSIDVDYFLQLVADYTEAQNRYNIKWSIFSDCMVPTEPSDVICQDNLPVFVY